MKYLIFISLFFVFNKLSAQDHNHDHEVNHLGIGFGVTSFFEEGHSAPGLHLHYMHRLNSHSPFSIGGGYEAILGDHEHHSLTGLLGYSPFDRFSIKVGPGLTFANENEHKEVKFSGHLELMYEFELGDLHLGPMLGFGYDGEETHGAVGIHVGFGF